MKTILVVDDDDLLVESLTDLLELEGYGVVSAQNGKDGLARLEKENPDLVLTNVTMPIPGGPSGVEGVDASSKPRSIPVVLMSTSHQGVPVSARTVGVSAFLNKPFGLDELLPIIERLIGKGEAEKV
jgi:CheY-like chemotaxis protein